MADKAIYSCDTASSLGSTNKIYINTGNNIRQITAKDISAVLLTQLKLYAYTGKNLGTSYTAAQQAEVNAGTFNGLNIGDYWVINGINWRIWDIDWYLNKGDTSCSSHHLVIIPDSALLTANGNTTHYMNATNTSVGGYVGTDYRNTYRAQCLEKVKTAFGDHVLKHRELMCNGISSSGTANSWTWTDADVELPSEIMMYGSTVWSNSGYNTGTAHPQLELARLCPKWVVNRSINYWLRDVAGSSSFACVYNYGSAGRCGASDAWDCVRPYFLLH